MGIKQRRESERQEIRQEMRQSILSAARQIAAEEGWQAVTTRKVAERIEYSKPSIYEYFENKEAMLLALLRSGYQQLVTVMQEAVASTDDPEARLLAMTEAYWHFAFRSPELYQVMHGLAGISFGRYGHPDTPIEVKQSFALAREAMGLCCKKVDTLVNSASIREQKRSFLHEEPESVQMASFRSRDHSAVCPVVPALLSQLP